MVASFPPMDRRRRLEQLAGLIDGQGAELMVVTKPENVRYLTGFGGTGWAVIRCDGEAALATDNRYRGRAEQELAAAGLDPGLHFDGSKEVTAITDLAGSGRMTVLVEGDHLTLTRFNWFTEKLAESQAGHELTPSSELVETLRLEKDEGEVARLAHAGAIVAGVFDRITTIVQPGMTERQAAKAFDRAAEDAGGEGPAFDTLVAAGANASSPHWTAGDRVIGENELVLIDGGTIVDGYRSDVTRTFSFGDPSATEQELVELARAAYDAVANAATATSTYRELDQIARKVITDAGYEDALLHPTGHNVGLAIHEHPFLAEIRPEEEVVGPNRVVTIEPGVYLSGSHGARFEDMFLITNAPAERLSPRI